MLPVMLNEKSLSAIGLKYPGGFWEEKGMVFIAALFRLSGVIAGR